MKLTPRQKLFLLRHYLKFKRTLRRDEAMKVSLTEILAIIDGALAIAEIVVKWTPSDKDNEALAKIKELREKFRPLFGASADGDQTVELTADQVAEVKALVDALQAQCDGCCDD